MIYVLYFLSHKAKKCIYDIIKKTWCIIVELQIPVLKVHAILFKCTDYELFTVQETQAISYSAILADSYWTE